MVSWQSSIYVCGKIRLYKEYFFNHILIDQKVHNIEGTEGSSLTT